MDSDSTPAALQGEHTSKDGSNGGASVMGHDQYMANEENRSNQAEEDVEMTQPDSSFQQAGAGDDENVYHQEMREYAASSDMVEDLNDVKPSNVPMPGRKPGGPDVKRPGKESGRFFKCYWANCDKIYTRRRTVTDHMIKEHKIKREDFVKEQCREIKYVDEEKTRWVEIEAPERRRVTKKGGTALKQQSMSDTNHSQTTLEHQQSGQPSTNGSIVGIMGPRKRRASVSDDEQEQQVAQRSSPASSRNSDDEREQASPHSDAAFQSGEDGEDYEDEDEVYCICRKEDDGSPMVACDGCDEWYHIRCVNLHKDEVTNLLVKYYCKDCNDKKIGISIFRNKCGIGWCRKASTPESKYSFCGDQHQEDYLAHLIKRSDPNFVIKSKEGQALYAAWLTRQRKKYGSAWEPAQNVKLVEGMDKLNVNEEGKLNLGGNLRTGELKALVSVAESLEAFKELGKTGAQPIKSNPRFDMTTRNLPALDENGDRTKEQDVLYHKELVDLRRQALHAAKAKHKPRVFCGYDERLAYSDNEFKKAMEASEATYKPCTEKNCRQHVDWIHNETKNLAMETTLLRDQAMRVGIRLV